MGLQMNKLFMLQSKMVFKQGEITMKRIALLCIVLTITLTSVCWADEITGTWIMDRTEMSSSTATQEELDEANAALAEMGPPTYIVARSDGTMTLTYDNSITLLDVRIGKWYKYAPDRYVYLYDFSTLTGPEEQKVYQIEIIDEKLIFYIERNEEFEVYKIFNKVEEE